MSDGSNTCEVIPSDELKNCYPVYLRVVYTFNKVKKNTLKSILDADLRRFSQIFNYYH